MTCRALPCPDQMARLRGMITQIALGSLAAAPVPAPRPARDRPAAVSDMATGAVVMPDAPAGTPAREPPSLSLADCPARPDGGGIPFDSVPEPGKKTAGHHDERWRPPPVSSAGGYGGRHTATAGGVQAPALQNGIRRPHPPALSPLPALQERGSTPRYRRAAEAAPPPPAVRPARAPLAAVGQKGGLRPMTDTSADAGALMQEVHSRAPLTPSAATALPPPLLPRNVRPVATAPPLLPYHPRPPSAAASAGAADASGAWYAARGGPDARPPVAHVAPPPLAETTLCDLGGASGDAPGAGDLSDDAVAQLHERRMRLDAAR